MELCVEANCHCDTEPVFNSCQANQCLCSNGVHNGAGFCVVDGAEECASCDSGYYSSRPTCTRDYISVNWGFNLMLFTMGPMITSINLVDITDMCTADNACIGFTFHPDLTNGKLIYCRLSHNEFFGINNPRDFSAQKYF